MRQESSPRSAASLPTGTANSGPPGLGSQGLGQGCSLGDGAQTADFWAFLRKNWNASILEPEATFRLGLMAQGGLALSPFRVHVWGPAPGSGPSAHASECGRGSLGGEADAVVSSGDFKSTWEVAFSH